MEMDHYHVPMQKNNGDEAILKRRQEHQPIERVHCTRLHLADQRLASPVVWIPKWKPMLMPLSRLELEPWRYLLAEIGRI